MKLEGGSLSTDLIECFYYETKYVKMIKYIDDMRCCDGEGLSGIQEELKYLETGSNGNRKKEYYANIT